MSKEDSKKAIPTVEETMTDIQKVLEKPPINEAHHQAQLEFMKSMQPMLERQLRTWEGSDY